jgi:transposase
MTQEDGALVQFLPPYSLDYNPIEEAFSKVKTNLKAMELETESSEDTENLVLASFSTITQEDCQQWIANARIYNTQQ